MRSRLGMTAFVLVFGGLTLTVAGFRDTPPDGFFVPFRWFGPVLLGFSVVLTGAIIMIKGD